MSNAAHLTMQIPERRRLPISTRRALALALDLAARRDAIHSLLVPMALRAPWILALVLLPPMDAGEVPARLPALATLALIGDFITMLVVGAMLRIRARSVFNTLADARPAPVLECYAAGARRIPPLLVTEVVRNLVLALAASPMVLPTAFARLRPDGAGEDLGRNLVLIAIAILLALPALFVLFRLGVATEAVVLDEQDLAGAFQRSFRLMRGHAERWLELSLASGAAVVVPALGLAAASLAIPALSGTAGLVLYWMMVVTLWPIVQYAWAFFFLRLAEIEPPLGGPDRAEASAGARVGSEGGLARPSEPRHVPW